MEEYVKLVGPSLLYSGGCKSEPTAGDAILEKPRDPGYDDKLPENK